MRHRSSRPCVRPAGLNLLVASCLLSGATLLGCDGATKAPSTPAAEAAAQPAKAAKPVERAALLRDAFEVGTSIPATPHARDRARIQELAVVAAIELDESALAADMIDRIEGWRRGAAYADLAMHLIRQNELSDVKKFLARAEASWDGEQAWQRQRVQAKIAAAYSAMGAEGEAARYEKGLDPSETGPIAAERAKAAGTTDLDAQLRALDEIVAQKNFDLTRNAIVVYIELLRAAWPDAAQRDAIVARLREAMVQVPNDVRVTTLCGMAEVAQARGDRVAAGKFLADADASLDEVRWHTEDRMQLRARLATGRAQAGDTAAAARMLREELAAFDAARATMIDIFRAAPLRAVAIAQAKVAELETDPAAAAALRAAALETFRRAVEEGAVNPNARPRAEDLAETSVAMARAGIDPDAALKARMLAVRAGLVAPW